jgi:hypothetical protein
MKKTSILLCIAGIFSFLLSSCQKESTKSNAELIIKATSPVALNSASALTSFASKSALAGLPAIVFDTFLINIEDIKFEFEESNNGNNNTDDSSCNDNSDDCSCDDKSGDCPCDDACNDSTYDDIEAEGPYLIDIMSPEVLNGMVLDSYTIPNAVYDEVEFELARYGLTDNSKMIDRSVYLAGTIDGNRFRFWTNQTAKIEIEFPDQSPVSINGENAKLYIDISLGKIKANLEAMNLTSAVDGNSNGYIEIGNDDTDGNNALAKSLLKAITGCFDLDDENDED